MLKFSPVRIIAAIVFLYSSIVMFGWIFDFPALTGILPNHIQMQFITAFSFFLSSIALWFIDLASKGEREIPLIILPATSMLTLLITTTTLAAGMFAVHTGITDLFLKENIVFENVLPGVPSLMTIIGFILFSTAGILVLNDLEYSKLGIIYFGILLILIGSIASLGYLFEIPVLYYRFSAVVSPMALNTALVFILLGLGLMWVERKQKNENK